MLSVVSTIVQCVFIIPSIVKLRVIMLIVNHAQRQYAVRHYAGRHNAEHHYTGRPYALGLYAGHQ
jgi:hypothetical protein